MFPRILSFLAGLLLHADSIDGRIDKLYTLWKKAYGLLADARAVVAPLPVVPAFQDVPPVAATYSPPFPAPASPVMPSANADQSGALGESQKAQAGDNEVTSL